MAKNKKKDSPKPQNTIEVVETHRTRTSETPRRRKSDISTSSKQAAANILKEMGVRPLSKVRRAAVYGAKIGERRSDKKWKLKNKRLLPARLALPLAGLGYVAEKGYDFYKYLQSSFSNKEGGIKVADMNFTPPKKPKKPVLKKPKRIVDRLLDHSEVNKFKPQKFQ